MSNQDVNTEAERRKERRTPLEFTATLSWEDVLQHEVTEQTHTVSISAGGACLLSTKRIPLGQRVRVSLEVGGHSGSSWAVVKWSRPTWHGYYIGVCFHSDPRTGAVT